MLSFAGVETEGAARVDVQTGFQQLARLQPPYALQGTALVPLSRPSNQLRPWFEGPEPLT